LDGASNRGVVAGDRDTGAWRERFRNGISAISHKAACEAPVIADVVWKSCYWKATFIERECGGAIIAAGERIVEDDCVSFVIPTNCNSIQRVIFYFGSRGAIIDGVVEVAYREQFEPSFGVGFGVVDELEWSGKFAAETARNLVQHGCCMRDGIVPELTTDLFFSNVSSSHRDESAPGAFSQAVGRLTTCVGSDDSGIVTVDPFEGLTADEFGVEIVMEFLGNSIYISTKGLESPDDVIGGE